MRRRGNLPELNGVVLLVSAVHLFGSVGSEFFEVSIVPTMDANMTFVRKLDSSSVGSDFFDISMLPTLDSNKTFFSESAIDTVDTSVEVEGRVADKPTEPEPAKSTNIDAKVDFHELPLIWRRNVDCDNETNANKTINDTNPCYYQPKSYELNYSTMFLILIPLLVSIFLLCVGYCIRQRIWWGPSSISLIVDACLLEKLAMSG